MTRALRILAFLLGLAWVAQGAPRANLSAELNRAAGLYYQARYDSALATLEGLLGGGPWKRRDSLSLYQYLGMSSARLGRDSTAAGYFSSLLSLDSLFRFPKNEDAAVLAAFAHAREKRLSRAPTPVTSVLPSDPDSAGDDAAEPAASHDFQAAPTPAPAVAAAPATSLSPATAPARASASALDGSAPHRPMTLAYGAIPFGGGWFARNRYRSGLSLGILQAAGLVLSMYASEMQSRDQNDSYGLRAPEVNGAEGWQWTQRITLSIAVGAYLYSIFASKGE